MSHFPRVPLNHQYPDLFKSSMAEQASTTHMTRETVPEAHMEAQYRTPTDRANGNEIFRRLPNGLVDMAAAMYVVLAALNQLKYKGPLNDMETRILVACFPEAMRPMFPDSDGRLSMQECKSRLRVSEDEIKDIARITSAKLMELHEWLLFGMKM